MAVTDSVGVGSDPVMRGNALQTDRYRRGVFMRVSRVVVMVVVHLLGRKASCMLTDAVSREKRDVFAGAVGVFSLEKIDLVWFVKFVGRGCGWK
jgi:hypothetical protein